MVSAKEEILGRLKKAQERRNNKVLKEPDFSSPIYPSLDEPLDLAFKKNLELASGKVILTESLITAAEVLYDISNKKGQDRFFCADPILINAFKSKIKIDSDEKNFQKLNIGITRCEFLVAHLGSVLISSSHISGRRLNVFPETHIVLACKNQIIDYLDNAMKMLQEKYKNNLPSLITNITGPSRTADIEKTLVMGMHGPKDLIVILTNEPF